MKNLIKLLFILLITGIFFMLSYDNQSIEFAAHSNNYVYDNDSLVYITDDESSLDIIEKNSNDSQNIDILNSLSLIQFNSSNDQLNNLVESLSETKVEAYEYTIDDYSIVVNSEENFETAFNNILQIYLSEQAFQEYLSTGVIPNFSKDGRDYTEFSINSDITSTEGFYNEDDVLSTVEEIQFKILNGDNIPQYDYISEDKNISDIMVEHDISQQVLELNNPGLTVDKIYYVGEEVVVNEPDPVFNMEAYFETEENKELEYQTFRQPSDELASGVEEVDTEGENGTEHLVLSNKIINGEVVGQTIVSNTITEQPVNEIVLYGTASTSSSSSGSSVSGSTESFDGSPDSAGFIWPESCRIITNGYLGYPGHYAIDIQCGYGASIYAAAGGVVVAAGGPGTSGYTGYGNFVVIDHQNGYRTLYGHMSQYPSVSVGETVVQGQVVGYEGNTGYSTGHHLHYEVQLVDSSGNVISKPDPTLYYDTYTELNLY